MANLTNKQAKHLNRMLDSVDSLPDDLYDVRANKLITIFLRVHRHLQRKRVKRKRIHMK